MKFLFIILLILAAIYGSTAQAQEWQEYHEYLESQKANQKFITYDNPSWTREDMMIRRAMKSGSAKLERAQAEPEVQIANNKEYIFKDKDSANSRFNGLIDDAEMRRNVDHINELARYHHGR